MPRVRFFEGSMHPSRSLVHPHSPPSPPFSGTDCGETRRASSGPASFAFEKFEKDARRIMKGAVMLGRSECQRASPQQQTGMGKGEAGKRERAHRQVRESGSREILDRLSSPMRVMGMALHGPLFRQPARSPTHQSRRRAILCGSKAPRIFSLLRQSLSELFQPQRRLGLTMGPRRAGTWRGANGAVDFLLDPGPPQAAHLACCANAATRRPPS
ncbi:hypothetical protein B0J12DRAFT_114325 [Macrophomina phaseolina]|uniref:Uncharacterized protein n=1 Tax=Macrophomina phaseolina TaxID=35725 RepID=A0ABQ8G8U0_9PEZI|nr:hypothetical protein B0J12DRAFT_114325 [Macrophomina phaseolina]